MTVRPPQSLSPSFTRDSGLNLLEYELMSERADALGRHGLKVEKAIAALSVLEDAATTPDRREQLLNDAADAVWAFFIQREIVPSAMASPIWGMMTSMRAMCSDPP